MNWTEDRCSAYLFKNWLGRIAVSTPFIHERSPPFCVLPPVPSPRASEMENLKAWSTDKYLIVVVENLVCEIESSRLAHSDLLEEIKERGPDEFQEQAIPISEISLIRARNRRDSCELKHGNANDRSIIKLADNKSRNEFVSHIVNLSPQGTWIEEKTYEGRIRSAGPPAMALGFSAFLSYLLFKASISGQLDGKVDTIRADKKAIAEILSALESIVGTTGIAVLGATVTLIAAVTTVYFYLYPALITTRYTRASKV